tara:strand:+ start:368 stop:547 length:180 start_codon:yes stop_codon:yes gene_type:complete
MKFFFRCFRRQYNCAFANIKENFTRHRRRKRRRKRRRRRKKKKWKKKLTLIFTNYQAKQ